MLGPSRQLRDTYARRQSVQAKAATTQWWLGQASPAWLLQAVALAVLKPHAALCWFPLVLRLTAYENYKCGRVTAALCVCGECGQVQVALFNSNC